MPIDPQQIAQRIVDTIARTQGGSSNSGDESFVVNERVIRDRHIKGDKPSHRPKLGYVYSKIVSGVSAIVCAPMGDPTNTPQSYPPNSTQPYNPVPSGQTRNIRFELRGTDSDSIFTGPSIGNGYLYNYFPFSPINSRTFTLTLTSDDTLSYLDTVTTYYVSGINSEPILETRTSKEIAINGFGVEIVQYETYYAAPGYDKSSHANGTLNLYPLDGPIIPVPDPNSPNDPSNPSSPDPNQSYEFWYNSAIAKTPVKLKQLAANQPLEIMPYIVHQSQSLSYVVLKYGNADNNAGSSDDWCKISLFAIKGTKTLKATETIYPWTQENSVQSKLKAAKTLFAAIAGSKTKLANINIGNLITAGKLNAKLRCFTHRNLSNLKQSIYLLDPILNEDSSLDDLAGEGIYDYGAIRSNLVANPQILANLRYFELKKNPSYTGSAENCASNPAFKLVEKKTRRIKKVKVKGLASTDASIQILTLNCGVV